MSQIPTAENYNLASSPHTRTEIQAAMTEIVAWLDSGAIPSAAPVDALTKWVRQLLAVGNSGLDELTDPAERQAMSLEWKQEYLDRFRKLFELRDGIALDVAGSQAEAERLQSEAQSDRPEVGGKVAKWTKLATMLREKEDMERRFGEQVVELKAEEDLR